MRGPQSALYADPKTGATWSGRGRAPACLAGAKDRSWFLIGGAAGASNPKVRTATKGVVAKKAAAVKRATLAKKVAAKKVVVRRPRGFPNRHQSVLRASGRMLARIWRLGHGAGLVTAGWSRMGCVVYDSRTKINHHHTRQDDRFPSSQYST